MDRIALLFLALLLVAFVPQNVQAAPDHDRGDRRHHDRGWDDHRDRDRRHDNWELSGGFTVCQSRDYRRARCSADIGNRNRVRLVRQLSDSPCRLGSSWGWTRNAIWVNNGCAGEFVIERGWR